MGRRAADNASAPFAAPGWWDPAVRAYASLRSVNELRLRLLAEWWSPDARAGVGAGAGAGEGPATVVDLGCGGGLAAVPLARAGARVLGVDLLRAALGEARAQGAPRALFVCGDLLRVPVAEGCADLVLLSDVLEHLDEPAAAVLGAARLLRPGGVLFVNTINRTRRARLLAVTLAEGLGLIPRGTHDPARFLTPDELAAMAQAVGLREIGRIGERPALWATLRRRRVVVRRSRNLSVGYCAAFRRPADCG